MRTPKITLGRVGRLGLAAAVAAAGVIGFTSGTSYAGTALTLSSATGPGGGTAPATGLTVTGSGFKNVSNVVVVSGLGAVQFQSAASCSTASHAADANDINVPVANYAVASTTKINLVIPAGALALGTSNASKVWNLCIYATGVTGPVGTGKYTVYQVPVFSSIVAPLTSSASVLGGSAFTIVGSGFTSKTSVTIGGTAVSGAKANTAGTQITGTVPAGTAGAKDVVITTEGGPSTTGTGAFTYLNSISVSPSTAKTAASPDQVITVRGAGFKALNFATTADVVFNVGPYTGNTNIVASCASTVLVLSDSELTCTMPGTASLPDGAYSIIVLADNTQTTALAAGATAITSGATFTVANF